ncbi:MAG: DUF4091 domain-containing protein [bacterium]|nr:DUF4091 domain-containing protein [bacterium]
MRIALTITILAIALSAAAAERGVNLVDNPGFETDGVWASVGGGFVVDESVAHGGTRSMRCSVDTTEGALGARQVIVFDPPIQHPFRVSGWARAEDAVVEQDFNVYLDLHYADGTPLWGKIAGFKPGTHDWQYAELDFDVTKPVKTIEVHVLFRHAKGTVWFDDIEVSLTPFAVPSLDVAPGLFGDGLGIRGRGNMPASWRVVLLDGDTELKSAQGDAWPLRLFWRDLAASPANTPYTLRVNATDDLLGEKVSVEREVTISPAAESRPYAVWTETSMRRVMPDAFPPDTPDTPEVPQARIALAGHEYESFQVALMAAPDQGLGETRVDVSDLVLADGTSRITADHIEWHQVGYVKADNLPPHPAAPDASPGWWPDALLPVETFTVAPGFTQALWFTVYTPAGTPPGDYTGTVTLHPANAPATTVTVKAQIYGFDLSVRGHFKTAFALMDGFLERVYGKPLTPALRQQYGDYVLKHRLNPDDISRTSAPAVEDLVHFRDQGLNTFNVMNMVEERGERTWVCYSAPEVYTPAFKEQVVKRLDPAVAQLRQHGLADMAYVYTFDERGRDFWPTITEYFGLVKERYPEIKTFTTAYIPQDPEVMHSLNLDWNCPLTAKYNYEQAEKCRAAGLQVWAYICLGPRYPYANWLCEHPLVESRVIWWQAYHQKMDGFLYWGLNIWNRPNNTDLVNPADGPFLEFDINSGGTWPTLYGDGRLLYPGIDGPIGSIRLANIRDGLEDYEYLYALAERTGDVETARTACLPVTTTLVDFTRDPDVVCTQRAAIAERVSRMGREPRQ